MPDEERHSPTWPDLRDDGDAILTLDVVGAEFAAAGLPRSLRTLQRYCGNGTLDCVKEATDTGDTYFVRRQSIAPAITALRQLHEAKAKHRPGATERAVSLADGPDAEPPMDVDTDRSGPATSDVDTMANTGRRTAAEPDTSPYVFQLEKRIEEKDDEIGFLREELTDRRGQIRDMKGIIDGQNQLLETINANVAPIFQALATSVKRKDIEPPKPADVASRIIDGDEKSGAQPHGSQN